MSTGPKVKLSQNSQVECDYINALREYERAHAIWMNTVVFSDEGVIAKRELERTRAAYISAHHAKSLWINK